MRAGEVTAHLPTLLGEVAAPAYLPELIAAKAEAEHVDARDVDGAAVARDVQGLHEALDRARERSTLPDTAGGRDALHDLVVRTRLTGRASTPPSAGQV